jgi:hypothetical protein
MPVIGTLAASLDKADKGVPGALPVGGPDSGASAIGEIARISFGASCVVARRAAGRWGSCTTVDSSVSLSSKVPMPLSLNAAEFLAAFAGRSCDSAAVDTAAESFRVVLSLLIWRGGDAIVCCSQQRYPYLSVKLCRGVGFKTHLAFDGRCSL